MSTPSAPVSPPGPSPAVPLGYDLAAGAVLAIAVIVGFGSAAALLLGQEGEAGSNARDFSFAFPIAAVIGAPLGALRRRFGGWMMLVILTLGPALLVSAVFGARAGQGIGLVAVPPALAMARPLAVWRALEPPRSVQHALRSTLSIACVTLAWSFATVVPCAFLFCVVVSGPNPPPHLRLDRVVVVAVVSGVLAAVMVLAPRRLGAEPAWVRGALRTCWTVAAIIFVVFAFVAFVTNLE